jgi:Flp pilus assembly pilin Flp
MPLQKAMNKTFAHLVAMGKGRQSMTLRLLRRVLVTFAADSSGVTSLEYAVLAFGIIIAVSAAVAALSPGLLTAFTNIGNSL